MLAQLPCFSSSSGFQCCPGRVQLAFSWPFTQRPLAPVACGNEPGLGSADPCLGLVLDRMGPSWWRWVWWQGALCCCSSRRVSEQRVTLGSYQKTTAFAEFFSFRCSAELSDAQLCFNLIFMLPFLICLQYCPNQEMLEGED